MAAAQENIINIMRHANVRNILDSIIKLHITDMGIIGQKLVDIFKFHDTVTELGAMRDEELALILLLCSLREKNIEQSLRLIKVVEEHKYNYVKYQDLIQKYNIKQECVVAACGFLNAVQASHLCRIPQHLLNVLDGFKLDDAEVEKDMPASEQVNEAANF